MDGRAHGVVRRPRGGDPVSVLLILIAVSIGVALLFLAAFGWAVRTGQFDDTDTPSLRMLSDDDVMTTEAKKNEEP